MAGTQLTKNVVIVVSLVAAGFLTAWLRYRDALGQAGRYSDGEHTLAADEAEGLRFIVWDSARALAFEAGPSGEVETLHRPALSPDGRWLVGFAGERGLNADLYVSERGPDGFGRPRPVATVNTAADELDPAFSATHLWFASDRRGGAGGLDLWRARWDATGFGAPERVDGGVNGTHDERGPAPSADERALVFASNRPGHGGFDLLRATRAVAHHAWQIAFQDELCTRFDELDPALVDGARALVFASDRPGAGGFDLLRAVWSEGVFADPEPIEALNGPADERGAAPEADGFALVFERGRVTGDGERAATDSGLVRARSRELLRLPGRPVGWLDLVLLATLLLLALLAWLAKRWPGLDVLWKCILISLVVHLLLAWWFRYLFVEPETYQLQGEGERFRVRLVAGETGTSNGLVERAGVLEVARSEVAFEAAERHASAADTPAPSALAPSLTGLRLAAAEPAAAAPEREAFEAEPRGERALETSRVDLDDAPPAFRPVLTAAPQLALGSAASTAISPTRSTRALSAPERAPVTAGASARAPSAGQPSAANASAFERDLGADALPTPVARSEELDLRGPERSEREAFALADAPERPERSATESAPELVLVPRALVPRRASDATATGDGPAQRIEQQTASTAFGPSAGEARPAALPGLERDLASPAGLAAAPTRAHELDGERRPERSTGAAPRRVSLADAAPQLPRETAPRPASAPAFDPLASLMPGAELVSPGRDVSPATRARDAGFELERAGQATTVAAPSAAPVFTPLAALERSSEAPPQRPLEDAARRWQETPYQSRAGGAKTRAIELYGGSVETERAVVGGLAYLARVQTPLGAWGSVALVDDKYGQVAVGKTGLALLAFLGAGHTHESGSEHSDVVRRGLAFLLAVQDERSGHFGRSSAYGHGIATYALAECYALTADAKLRGALERATDQVLANQNKHSDRRLFGGWSYYYADDRVWDAWPRVSITAWQVMALESARLGGLSVPDMAFDDAREFLEAAKDPGRDWYRYSHDPERLRSGYPTLPASTPAALFALSLLGENLEHPSQRAALTFLMERAPRGYRYTGDDDFVRRGQGNVYFWYYGTLATFRVGGRAWEVWNEAMKETLVPAQEQDGSWRPLDIYARSYARDDDRDRSYTTAMCVLSLEVYYRYYLPLLKVR